MLSVCGASIRATNEWHIGEKNAICRLKLTLSEKKKVKSKFNLNMNSSKMPNSTSILTGEPFTLKPDEYVYTFSCQLPDDLPTSLQGSFGSIRYTAAVTINVPLWSDKTYEENFTVIKTVNLNDMFELKVNLASKLKALMPEEPMKNVS